MNLILGGRGAVSSPVMDCYPTQGGVQTLLINLVRQVLTKVLQGYIEAVVRVEYRQKNTTENFQTFLGRIGHYKLYIVDLYFLQGRQKNLLIIFI